MELVHKEGQRTFETDPQNIEFGPQGEGRTSESGPRKVDRTSYFVLQGESRTFSLRREDRTLNVGPLGRTVHLELVNKKIA